MDLSVIIPARNEEWLQMTIDSVLNKATSNTEVIAILDGYWPKVGIEQRKNLTIIHHEEPIGQRAATNEGVRVSAAKYMMKLDAHCDVDEGFDTKLIKDCEYDWTVIPRMYNLHVFDWKCKKCSSQWYMGPFPEKCDKCDNTTEFERVVIWKPRLNRRSDFMRFDSTLHFQYWRDYENRPEAKGQICDLMSSVGACWFMHRQRYLDLGGLDEGHGSWGQVGTELACKSWLSGGRQVINKNTWFSHMFRTQQGFGFPYQHEKGAIDKARHYSQDMWLNNKWPQAKYKLEWLIEKFSPVPDWGE
jgi:glycosyltransferase involved in cell wall biosynthesis